MEKQDVESQGGKKPSSFRIVCDQAMTTPEVMNWHYPGSGTDEDPYVVNWIDNDPRNPMNFTDNKKWALTMMVAFATLAVAFVSSAYTGGIDQILSELHTSQEIVTLGVSLFVLGFAIGPLLWAPLSELFGRQVLFIGTYAMLTFFNAGAAGSQNIQTLIILRFFAGAFGSSPLTNAGGVIADMFPASQRGIAMSLFASAPFMGPVLGPIVGGFVGETIGWRWVEGIMAIFTGVLWIMGSLLIPETYPPVLLRKRAAKMSKLTGKVYRSKGDVDQGPVEFSAVFKTSLSRPWVLLLKEPIVFLLSIYMAIIYGTLYMLFAAFPIVYEQQRGWSQGIGALPFLGVAVGMVAAVLYSMWDNKRYNRVAAAHGGIAPPEARLPPCMIGGIAVPIGLFWFAWTNAPSVQFMASICAGAPFGFGMVLIFLSIMNYLIDSYTIFAASVLAANSVLRSLFGAAFPLFTTQMYANLGIHWASSVPAFLALACVPMPFLFYKYGPAIRERCKYAAEAAEFMRQMMAQQQDSSETGSQSEGKSQSEEEKEEEKEQEVEQEAVESSYEPRNNAPRFEEIKTGSAAPGMLKRSSTYEASPYDIDRVATRDSFQGRSRASSRGNSRANSVKGSRL